MFKLLEGLKIPMNGRFYMKKKWLHVSDIHLNKRGVETRRIRSRLLEYLKENNIECDYVFFTGDLRFAPNGAFADDTHTFFYDLCETVNVTIENLFIVPGNHDVNRGDTSRMEAVNQIFNNQSEGYYDFKEGIIKPDDLNNLASGKREFIEKIEEIYFQYPDRVDLYKNITNPHFLVETEDFNILHIDSTIIYSADREQNLIIGTDLLLDLCEQINQKKPTILLTHYSFDFMHRNEQKVIIKLLEEYNIQLWFAGHEHDELIRKQRDFFYEFQCGNLLYDGKDAKACVILGEYDTEDYSGSIQLYCWFEPDGWALYPFISSKGSQNDIYEFTLENQESKITQIKNITKSPEYRQIGEALYAFNLNELDIKNLENMSDEEFCAVKEQMGTRLSGKESRQEIASMFFSEVQMSLNSLKRYDCMPMFQYVVRGTYKGFLHLDGSFSPLMEVKVCHFFRDDMDMFQISSDIFNGNIITINQEIIYIAWGYQLSVYPDVADRLMRFEKVREYLSANKAYIRMVEHEEYNLEFDVLFNRPMWEKMLNDTEFWYDNMKKIAKIEAFFGIKFRLPQTAAKDDYIAIDILSDSIDKKSCRHLPAIPMRNPGFRRSFTLENKVILNNALELPSLHLFGYTFKPISQYLLPGEFKWNKKLKGWISDFTNDGVAVGVDFELTTEEDINRNLIQYIPFEDVQEEFKNRTIATLSGEDADFFKYYIKLTYDFQEIWKLYLLYKEQLDSYIVYELDDQQRLINKNTGKIVDKAAINEMTNDIVAAGCVLIKRMDSVCKELFTEEYEDKKDFSSAWTSDSVGFVFMTIMKIYTQEGHFPINVDGQGYCYYNINEIEYMAQDDFSTQVREGIGWIKEEFVGHQLDLMRIPHYDMLRDFIYIVSMIHMNYYDKIESKMKDAVKLMNRILELHPELIIESGSFAGHVVYILDGEDVIHAFSEAGDVLSDFSRYRDAAYKHFSECSIGRMEL